MTCKSKATINPRFLIYLDETEDPSGTRFWAHVSGRDEPVEITEDEWQFLFDHIIMLRDSTEQIQDFFTAANKDGLTVNANVNGHVYSESP